MASIDNLTIPEVAKQVIREGVVDINDEQLKISAIALAVGAATSRTPVGSTATAFGFFSLAKPVIEERQVISHLRDEDARLTQLLNEQHEPLKSKVLALRGFVDEEIVAIYQRIPPDEVKDDDKYQLIFNLTTARKRTADDLASGRLAEVLLDNEQNVSIERGM